jgi:hypothetical protein
MSVGEGCVSVCEGEREKEREERETRSFTRELGGMHGARMCVATFNQCVTKCV